MSSCTHDPDATRCCNAREVLRLTELYLEGTVRYALASDARAATLCAAMATLMTAAAAVGAALLALPKGPLTPAVLFLATASVVTSLCFLMALWSASTSARPAEFDIPGNRRASFTDGDLDGDHAALLLAQAGIYDEQIGLNAERLRQSARHLNNALAWAGYAPVAAVLCGVVAVAMRFPSL
jgi:hypothetical protein